MPGAKVIGEPLRTDRLHDGRRQLVRELVVDIGEDLPIHADGFKVRATPRRIIAHVPKGFDTDYSSVPALARPVMGRWDRHDIAGVVHDFAYRRGVRRVLADRVWWIIARSGNRRLGPVRGFLGWTGLRLGGWLAYRKIQAREGNQRSSR